MARPSHTAPQPLIYVLQPLSNWAPSRPIPLPSAPPSKLSPNPSAPTEQCKHCFDNKTPSIRLTPQHLHCLCWLTGSWQPSCQVKANFEHDFYPNWWKVNSIIVNQVLYPVSLRHTDAIHTPHFWGKVSGKSCMCSSWSSGYVLRKVHKKIWSSQRAQ